MPAQKEKQNNFFSRLLNLIIKLMYMSALLIPRSSDPKTSQIELQ